MPGEVPNMLLLLHHMCREAHLPRTSVHAFLPSYLFDGIDVA